MKESNYSVKDAEALSHPFAPCNACSMTQLV